MERRKMFTQYLIQLSDIAQNITHDNFVAIQKIQSDILNSYTDGKLTDSEKRALCSVSSTIINYMRTVLQIRR